MKRSIIYTILFLVAFQLNAQEIKWISFEKAVELNKKDPKPMMISVYADWCGWCKKMDQTTYKNPVLTKYISENFYAVKLNGEQKEDIVYNGYTFKYKKQGRRGYNEFAAALLDGKLSYPTTVFMNKEVKTLDRIPGYLDKKIMEQIVTYFATDKYKTVKWEDYVKKFKSKL